jgi:hypothetical protein
MKNFHRLNELKIFFNNPSIYSITLKKISSLLICKIDFLKSNNLSKSLKLIDNKYQKVIE